MIRKRKPLIIVEEITKAVNQPEFRSVKVEKVNRSNNGNVNFNRTDYFSEPPPRRQRTSRPHSGGCSGAGGGGEAVDETKTEFRTVKAEKVNRSDNDNVNFNRTDYFSEPPPRRQRTARPHNGGCSGGGGGGEAVDETKADRRVIRSSYLSVQNLINEEKEELCKGSSNRFERIMKEVDNLHQQVTKPREQVTDAETLLDMANTLVATVRSYSKDGLTPSDFISSLIRNFGVARSMENDNFLIKWDALGMLVCPVFKKGQGCATMIGPMQTQLKPKKVIVRRRRTRVTGAVAKPEQLEHSQKDQQKDTDKNMATMFNILRSKKTVRLENLILNRISFAQTVENLFALSFLVKDGRARISVNDEGTHLVSPKNAPSSDSVTSGEVLYHHFVFRFDFKDWKLMVDIVPSGEELMPHRHQASIPLSQADIVPNLTPVAIPISQADIVPNLTPVAIPISQADIVQTGIETIA